MNKSFFLRKNKHGWTQLYMKPFDGTFKSWHFLSEIQDGCYRRTSWQIVVSNLNWVKPKTIELVFATSLLSTQHEGARAKTSTDWLGIRIMCQSGATSLFQWASTIKISTKHVDPVQRAIIIISSKCNLFLQWIQLKNCSHGVIQQSFLVYRIPFYTPTQRESGVYRDPRVRSSITLLVSE